MEKVLSAEVSRSQALLLLSEPALPVATVLPDLGKQLATFP